MTVTADRLIELLPSVYGIRDGDSGPLRELLGVIAEQVGVLEEDLAQLYDDQFVETCAPWVLPYIGDLLGIAGLPTAPLTPRAEVAHTIAYRRRKGTAALLEQLARDVTGVPARAVECFELLAATQHLNHLRPECLGTVSLRDALRLEALGGPFERLSPAPALTHTVDVRRIESGRGRYNIPNVAIFLWRLRALGLTRSPAVADASAPLRRFRFSPLGHDAPLFTRPETEDEITGLAEPRNVPAPISRRAADADLEAFYGDARSILVEGAAGPLTDLRVCDLSDWDAPAGRAAIDPLLGRIVVPDDADGLLVSFHSGLAGNLGGGEYDRPLPAEAHGVAIVEPGAGPGALLAAVQALPAAGGVVEIGDSGRYDEPALAIEATGRRVTVRAAVGARPTVVLGAPAELSGDAGGAIVLDGLLITGAPVRVGGTLGSFELRHATLVPGLTLATDGAPVSGDEPSLVVGSPVTEVLLERSIAGAIRAVPDAAVRVVEAIVDATARTGIAFAAPGGGFGARLVLEQATVIGRIKADVLELVSNSLLVAASPADADPENWPGPVLARRRQDGCVRFTHVPAGSRTPRRHRCVPEREADAALVTPVLTSLRYGEPGDGQLADATPAAIAAGADDESELGAFHHLHFARREAHLRARLQEHLRFGLEVGVFHAS